MRQTGFGIRKDAEGRRNRHLEEEYGKVIDKHFTGQCKANKQTILNGAEPDEVLASVKDARCKAWRLKLSGKTNDRPDHLNSRGTGNSTTEASDAVNFKSPDEILELVEGGIGREDPITEQVNSKITIGNICRSQAL